MIDRTVNNYNIARKFNSASVLHIPIEHADDVNKLFVIPRVVNVSLTILSLLSASITQQYTMKRLPCRKFKRKRLNLLTDSMDNRKTSMPIVRKRVHECCSGCCDVVIMAFITAQNTLSTFF